MQSLFHTFITCFFIMQHAELPKRAAEDISYLKFLYPPEVSAF